ncbi:MAG: Glucose-1-phosphate cytidylyltransferase [uncultured Thermoleophilia bacterium]|uniref:Glucose-1-phosphate cytidylyltransferase n=1 Tax=uncultured Thermoleophilia bacterium TaxID=1497501 RepID=A0A6J4U065_9ACTN|nr:MAG: Glucose-1-phosphate cytidylyltransferase [uncultured Thermoleophilia bacterium]
MSERRAPSGPKVVILCGGQGTRMREETEFRPKPMVEIGGRPLLWHLMKHYAAHGFADFVLCLGYRGAMVKDYFLDYRPLNSDVTVDLRTGGLTYETDRPEDWRVTLADTGEDAMTGARVKRVERYLGDADLFLCTYGDGLADVGLGALLHFHRSHGRLATVTGVNPPARFGRLGVDGDAVRDFAEKPVEHGRISSGFFVFSRAVLDHLSGDAACVLEREPLQALAAADELRMYRHDGFWQCADTIRDVELLRGLWAGGTAPWRTWDDRAVSGAEVSGDRRDAHRSGPTPLDARAA